MNLSKRIYTAFVLSAGLWCVAIVAAPVLYALGGAGGRTFAEALYLGFSRICHQLDGRSLHLFGAKFGVCVRCTSIYFSFFLGLLLYPFFRSLDSGSIPNVRWLLVAVFPMAADAALNDLGIHRSDELTRVVTGSVAGFIFALFILPLFLEALKQLFIRRNLQGDSRYAGQAQ